MKRIYFITSIPGLNALTQLEYSVEVHAGAPPLVNQLSKVLESRFLVSVEYDNKDHKSLAEFLADFKQVVTTVVKDFNNHFIFK